MKQSWYVIGLILGLYGVFMMLFLNVVAIAVGGEFTVSFIQYNEMWWELVMNGAFFLTLFTITIIAVKEYLRCK